MRCVKCGRALKRDGIQGMGPVCAAAVLGAKPRRPRLFDKGLRKQDDRQPDMFEVRA